MISRKTNSLNTDFLSKYWTKIWRIWRTDSRFELQNVINFITNDENSDQFARQPDVIFKDFQKSKMTHVLIRDCQYWKFCRKIDWISDSIIEAISIAREKNRLVMINRYVFRSIFEQEEWFRYWLFEEILWRDLKTSRRNIELIEWVEKNDRFTRVNRHVFELFLE